MNRINLDLRLYFPKQIFPSELQDLFTNLYLDVDPVQVHMAYDRANKLPDYSDKFSHELGLLVLTGLWNKAADACMELPAEVAQRLINLVSYVSVEKFYGCLRGEYLILAGGYHDLKTINEADDSPCKYQFKLQILENILEGLKKKTQAELQDK